MPTGSTGSSALTTVVAHQQSQSFYSDRSYSISQAGGDDGDQQIEVSPAGCVAEIVHWKLRSASCNRSSTTVNLQLTLQSSSNLSNTLGHLQLPLPHGWCILCDACGQHYYSNSHMRVTQYQHPCFGIVQPSVPIIPSGWEQLQDSQGHIYFGNPELKIVQYPNPSYGIVQTPAPIAAHSPLPAAVSYCIVARVPHEDLGSTLSRIFA